MLLRSKIELGLGGSLPHDGDGPVSDEIGYEYGEPATDERRQGPDHHIVRYCVPASHVAAGRLLRQGASLRPVIPSGQPDDPSPLTGTLRLREVSAACRGSLRRGQSSRSDHRSLHTPTAHPTHGHARVQATHRRQRPAVIAALRGNSSRACACRTPAHPQPAMPMRIAGINRTVPRTIQPGCRYGRARQS